MRILMITVLLGLVFSPLQAQAEVPLLEMLAFVPYNETPLESPCPGIKLDVGLPPHTINKRAPTA